MFLLLFDTKLTINVNKTINENWEDDGIGCIQIISIS